LTPIIVAVKEFSSRKINLLTPMKFKILFESLEIQQTSFVNSMITSLNVPHEKRQSKNLSSTINFN